MDFGNFLVPTILILSPMLATAYLILSGPAVTAISERTLGLGLSIFLAIVSIAGVLRFEEPVRLASVWFFSAEPTGYFEFSFLLHWSRVLWTLCFSLIFLSFFYFNFDQTAAIKSRRSAFNFLMGIFVSLNLMIFCENVLLSVIFFETALFLFYALSMGLVSGDVLLPKSSFLKRSGFLFLSLICLFLLSVFAGMEASSIVVLGLILYIFAFLLSRNSFLDWNSLPLFLIKLGGLLFLLSRVMSGENAPILWFPISIIFCVSSALFGMFSLLTLSSLLASFWFVLSISAYLFFVRFISGRPDDVYWVFYDVIALLVILGVSHVHRFGFVRERGWTKSVFWFFIFLFLMIVSGAFPWMDMLRTVGSVESPLRLSSMALLSFILAAASSKNLWRVFSDKQSKMDVGLAEMFVPCLVVLVTFIAALMRVTHARGEGPFHLGVVNLFSTPHVLSMTAGLGLGFLSGILLGSNNIFLNWIKNKEKRMEDFFPEIDSVVFTANRVLVTIPERFVDVASRSLQVSFTNVSLFVQKLDQVVWVDGLYQSFKRQGDMFSGFVGYLQSGSLRAYLVISFMILFFSSLLYLLEGRWS